MKLWLTIQDLLFKSLRNFINKFVRFQLISFFRNFNQIEAQFSKSTMNRAATCIQRWWRGFILRHRWNYLKTEVCLFIFSFEISSLI